MSKDTKHMDAKGNFDDLRPKRFGLKYNPPTLILEYLVPSTGKLFHRRMCLKATKIKRMDPKRVAEKLREKNPVYLAEDKIRFDQVVELVAKLCNHVLLGNSTLNSGRDKVNEESSHIAASTASTPATSSKSEADKETPVHDRGNMMMGARNTQDSDDRNRALSHTGVPNADPTWLTADKADADGGTVEEDSAVDLDSIDLNKVSDAELAMHKKQMDTQFFANRKIPGDADYVYDRRVDFPPPQYASEWDS